MEFIVLCLNYFLPPLCCFFISTTGGRLLGDLLCENVGQISCYWQQKIKINSFFFFLSWSVRDQTQDLEYGTQIPYHWAVSPSNSFLRQGHIPYPDWPAPHNPVKFLNAEIITVRYRAWLG